MGRKKRSSHRVYVNFGSLFCRVIGPGGTSVEFYGDTSTGKMLAVFTNENMYNDDSPIHVDEEWHNFDEVPQGMVVRMAEFFERHPTPDPKKASVNPLDAYFSQELDTIEALGFPSEYSKYPISDMRDLPWVVDGEILEYGHGLWDHQPDIALIKKTTVSNRYHVFHVEVDDGEALFVFSYDNYWEGH